MVTVIAVDLETLKISFVFFGWFFRTNISRSQDLLIKFSNQDTMLVKERPGASHNQLPGIETKNRTPIFKVQRNQKHCASPCKAPEHSNICSHTAMLRPARYHKNLLRLNRQNARVKRFKKFTTNIFQQLRNNQNNHDSQDISRFTTCNFCNFYLIWTSCFTFTVSVNSWEEFVEELQDLTLGDLGALGKVAETFRKLGTGGPFFHVRQHTSNLRQGREISGHEVNARRSHAALPVHL